MFRLDRGTGCRGYALDAEKLVSQMAMVGFEPANVEEVRAFAWQSGHGDLEWASEIAWKSIVRDREGAQWASARRLMASDAARAQWRRARGLARSRLIPAHRGIMSRWDGYRSRLDP